jgi:hypothetical protein
MFSIFLLLHVQTVKFLSPTLLFPSALPCLQPAFTRLCSGTSRSTKTFLFTIYISVNNSTIRLPDAFSGTLEKADANACSVRDRIDNKPIPREMPCDKPNTVLYKCTLQRSTRPIHGVCYGALMRNLQHVHNCRPFVETTCVFHYRRT